MLNTTHSHAMLYYPSTEGMTQVQGENCCYGGPFLVILEWLSPHRIKCPPRHAALWRKRQPQLRFCWQQRVNPARRWVKPVSHQDPAVQAEPSAQHPALSPAQGEPNRGTALQLSMGCQTRIYKCWNFSVPLFLAIWHFLYCGKELAGGNLGETCRT